MKKNKILSNQMMFFNYFLVEILEVSLIGILKFQQIIFHIN